MLRGEIPALNSDPLLIAVHREPIQVRIKGRAPRLTYSATFAQVYQVTESVPLRQAFEHASHLIQSFRRTARLTPLRDSEVSGALPDLLLRPVSPDALRGVSQTILTSPKRSALQVARAPVDKIAHSLAWIDVNIKLRVEDICDAAQLPDRTVRRAAECAQAIYASVLKADDYRLGAIISFNESAFVQERVVDVLFGSLAGALTQAHELRAALLNHAAQYVTSHSQSNDLLVLLKESVLAGGAIARMIRDGEIYRDDSLDGISSRFSAALDGSVHRSFSQDRDFRQLIARMASRREKVGWFFDDNGETVLDLRFIESALKFTAAQFTLFANTIAVSENITSAHLRSLIGSSHYPELTSAIRTGKVRIVEEAQYFRGLEPVWLTENTRRHLAGLDYAILKGASLYESYQDLDLDAYYAFVVVSPNSARLTSQPLDVPVIIRSPRGHVCH